MIHKITHYYQPTETSCGQASAAMLLSFYGIKITPQEVIKQIPAPIDKNGDNLGTANQHIAQWFISLGFDVDIYSGDFQILDLSWDKLDGKQLIERLNKTQPTRLVPALGKEFTDIYIDSYTDFIKLGGNLHINQYISSKLLDRLLESGPLLICVNYHVLYDIGRTREPYLESAEPDAAKDRLVTHTNILSGIKNGKYVINDPWEKPGVHEVDKELLIAAIQAAQMECDNLVIQIHRDKNEN